MKELMKYAEEYGIEAVNRFEGIVNTAIDEEAKFLLNFEREMIKKYTKDN